jgi:hypothetical protein
MPRPGGGMDPMAAMLNGLPPMAGPSPAGPPGGSPMGSDPGFDPALDGSALMKSLNLSLSDPYAAGPQGYGDLSGMGTGDPSMGLEQLLQLLALGQMGVGGSPGSPPPGSSGLMPDPGSAGMMGF